MKFKIITGAALLGFFIVMTSVFTAGFLSYSRNDDSILNPKTVDISKSDNEEVSNNNPAVLNEAEIAKHAAKDDCWVIVDSNVYDLTGFIPQHPGGAFLIEPYCGSDATSAFNSRDRSPPQSHSAFARGLLRNYYIGPLGKTLANIPQLSNDNNNFPTNDAKLNLPTVVPTSVVVASSQSLTLSLAEIATHNTLQNCWLIISGQVYDVTRFISQHPGGVTQITNWCGKEATTAFQTRGGKGGSHSTLAGNMLASYLIGSVGSSVSVNTPLVNGNTQSGGTNGTNSTSIPAGGCLLGLPQSICDKYGDSVILIEGDIEDDNRWEGKVNTSSGCRAIKTNSSGAIFEDKPC